MLSNKKYGLKYNQLLNLHENFTLSTIDYGAVLYYGASKINLNKLDSVHTSGLRLTWSIQNKSYAEYSHRSWIFTFEIKTKSADGNLCDRHSPK